MPTATRSPARPTGHQVVGGLGALCVLVIGLIGIPIVLAALVGWPLPHHVPSGGQAAHALSTSIPDSFWPRLFAALAWLAWAYFVFSAAASLIAQLRGHRPGRHSRLYGSGAMAVLIAAVLILGQLRGLHTARTCPTAGPVSVVRLMAHTTSTVVPLAPSSPGSVDQPATVIHAVVPGDTLWSIAVQYYGDGTQWQAIYQANVGLPQSGGGALSDAHWIYPGWSLTIPGATQSSATEPGTPAPAPAASISPGVLPTPVPAPTSSSVPQPDHHATHPPSSVSHATVSHRPRAKVGPHSEPDSHLAPEHRSSRPERHAGAPVRPPLALQPSAGSTSADSAGSRAAHKTRPTAPVSHGDDIGEVASGAGIFGLAAIGLVAALDRRRRRQIGRRSFGRHIPRPEPKSPVADLELQLRHYARSGQVFWLDHLAELLAYAAHRSGVAPPEVVGVELTDHGLLVVVPADSADPPVPFERRPGRPDIWYLPFTADPGLVDGTVADLAVPIALATVGRSATGTVLVNVDNYESIHITVAAEMAEGTLASMATELAGTTAPIGTTVIAVGLGYGVVDRLDGGAVVDDLDEAMALVRPDEQSIVLVDPKTTTDRLLNLVSGTENLHLVTAGPIAPRGTPLTLDPAKPFLDDYKLDPVQPSHVSDESLEEVQTLLEIAEDDSIATARDNSEMSEANPSGEVSPAGKITIGLIGEPSISIGDGNYQNLLVAVSPTAGTKARRVAELLVYLAAHDGTPTRGEWLTDVSPDKALSDGYVRNLVLLTRRSLEAITGDPDLLAYDKATQRFRLAERVDTDWSQFQSAVSVGDGAGLRTALALIRGIPFGASPDPWTSAGGLSYVLIDDITDAARSLGEAALVEGDPRLATWAARQGQMANRYDQGLWRILLRAAADCTALQQIWQELHDLLAVDGDPAADLEPATVDLYDLLNTPKRKTSEVVVLQGDDDAVIPTRRAV
jgi:hypothetical protein